MDHIKKKLINVFIDEVTTQGFECIPIFTMDEEERFISLKVSDESEVPIFEIYFSSGNYVSFYKSLKQSEGDLNWLFNKLFELLYELEEA